MAKKRYYRTGAVFEVCDDAYILTQVEAATYNLISLGHGSNRKTTAIKSICYCNTVSDRVIRRLIGTGSISGKTRKYKYLGQFPEVFERMGQ